MSTVARSPSEHYQEAERLLATAESPTVDPGLRDLSALLVIGHALLAAAPRRALRGHEPRYTNHGGIPPHLTWGDEQ
jgi:hypothetical protein